MGLFKFLTQGYNPDKCRTYEDFLREYRSWYDGYDKYERLVNSLHNFDSPIKKAYYEDMSSKCLCVCRCLEENHPEYFKKMEKTFNWH